MHSSVGLECRFGVVLVLKNFMPKIIVGYNGEFTIFEKQIIKIRHSKIQTSITVLF